MKENIYDNSTFFNKYGLMERSLNGLEGAGEWHELKKMLPDFTNKHLLDLGCGFGWHLRYAMENGAAEAVGVDISEKMIEKAKELNAMPGISYIQAPFEDITFEDEAFDVVISSLALHYTPDFSAICKKVHQVLCKKGHFIFSCEHPVFTASGPQTWHFAEDNTKLHWPVDHYFKEGQREASFLGERVTKYHKTMTTYVNTLVQEGFEITGFVEPTPDEEMMHLENMADELRRPMMLIISARKK